jgi:hypothetical protein
MKNIGLFLRRIIKIIPVLFIGLFLFFACENINYDPPKADPGKVYSFQTDIQPLFTSKCIGCHGTGKNKPTLDAGNAYNSLTGGVPKLYISVSSPESSVLYHQITKGNGHTSILTDLQKQIILEWIKQGAKNN